MGAVTFSLDFRLVAAMRQALPLAVLVETGTFEGGTAEEAAEHFTEVHTVELSAPHAARARARLAALPHVTVHEGESPAVLASLLPALRTRSVLFWLDAHWCAAEGAGGSAAQCPLLQELQAIGALGPGQVVLIDDARLFLCPPRGLHDPAHWPSFDAVLACLRGLSGSHEVAVVNDVLTFSPPAAADALRRYAAENGIDWLTVLDKSRDYDALLEQLAEKDRLIQGLNAVARAFRADLDAKEGTIQACLDDLNASLEQLAEKDRLIQELHAAGRAFQGDLVAKEAVIQELQDHLATKEAVIETLNRAVLARSEPTPAPERPRRLLEFFRSWIGETVRTP